MKYIFIVLCYVAFFCNAQCQNSNCNCIKYPVSDDLFQGKLTGYTINYDASKSLPQNYPFCTWGIGSVILSSNDKVSGEIIRYNGITDELEWLTQPNNIVIIDKSTIRGFSITSKLTKEVWNFKKVKIRNWYNISIIDAYLQVLVEGKISLYAYRKTNVTSSGVLLNAYSFFIMKEDGVIYNFTPTRKNLINLFPEKQDVLKSIYKKEHLRLRKEDQLIRAIQLFNEVL